jgi:hypothetical protein
MINEFEWIWKEVVVTCGIIKVFARWLTDVAVEIRPDNLPNRSPKLSFLSFVPQSKEEGNACCLFHTFKHEYLIIFSQLLRMEHLM